MSPFSERKTGTFQLVKKVLTNFFDCASPAKHFALGKMLLRCVAANSISFAAAAAHKDSRHFSSISLQLLSESSPLRWALIRP